MNYLPKVLDIHPIAGQESPALTTHWGFPAVHQCQHEHLDVFLTQFEHCSNIVLVQREKNTHTHPYTMHLDL